MQAKIHGNRVWVTGEENDPVVQRIKEEAARMGRTPESLIQAALTEGIRSIIERGLTYAQVASRLGISVSTLKRRIARHRQAVRPVRYGHRTVRLRPSDVERLQQLAS